MSDTLLNLVLIVVPLVVALGIYGILRDREHSAAGAGCLAAAVGLVLVALWTAYSVWQVL